MMLADLGQLIIQVVQYLWFFRDVDQWERGPYYVLAWYWKTVGPGKWPVIPYFMEVRACISEPGCFVLKRQDIETKDNKPLSFAATFEYQVEDVALAINSVEQRSPNDL